MTGARTTPEPGRARAVAGEVVPFRAGHGHPAARSTLVLGAVGGAGATTVACAIALLRAGRGERVTLIDLDMERSDLAGGWEVPADRTIDDLVAVADELEPRHVDLIAHQRRDGPRLLLAPGRRGGAAAWTAARVDALIACAGADGSVVVDAGSRRAGSTGEAGPSVARMVIVAPPTVAAARAVRAVTGLAADWCPTAHVMVAANQGVGRGHLSPRSFRRATGGEIDVVIPRADRDADACLAGRWQPRARGRFSAVIEVLARSGQVR